MATRGLNPVMDWKDIRELAWSQAAFRELCFLYPRAPHEKSGRGGLHNIATAARHIVGNALPVDKEADWPSCVDDFIQEKQFRCVYPPLVFHQSIEGGVPSIISDHGRWANKTKRRFLGIYTPPLEQVLRSYRRAPYKLLYRRLRK